MKDFLIILIGVLAVASISFGLTPEPQQKEIVPITIKISNYVPDSPMNMANGENWKDWYNKNTAACPVELEFGTKVIIGDMVYTCRDRGYGVVKTEEYYVIDIMTEFPLYQYGTIINGYYFYP